MFNQTAFNQTAFNRIAYNRPSEGYATIVISSIGSIAADCRLAIRNAANLSASSEFNPQAVHIILISYIGGGLSDANFNLTRAYIQSAVLNSLSELCTQGGATIQRALRFLGSFNPNDVVEIDMQRMTVTINGQNALHLVDGRFWELVTGRNTIKYTDSVASRQVALTVTFKDRWL